MLAPSIEAVKEKRRARGRPKADDVADLEARLIRVGRRNLIANGYGAASMNEIASAARVSKGTLYARFPSKADLFRAIIDAQILQTGVVTRPLRPAPKTLEASLRIFAERSLRYALSAEILELNRLIYSEAGRFPELGQAVFARSQIGIDYIAEKIREFALTDGIACRDPDSAAEMFVTLTRGFYADVMQRARPATVAEVKNWTRRTLRLFMAARPFW
jgi:AcrR family transcriptional regulator